MRHAVSSSVGSRAERFLADSRPGFEIIRASEPGGVDRMAYEVAEGLDRKGQKSLPCTYFYDQRGSELYERITHTPEYYPTRTEARLLQQLGPELKTVLSQPNRPFPEIVELGSGSSAKTRLLFDAWDADRLPITYIPVDVSESMLAETAQALRQSYRSLKVLGLAGQYEASLALLPPSENRLCLFLGGTIGNFTSAFQHTFFNGLARTMGPGAKLLVGFDRRPHAGKPMQVIESAYNDRQGITAEFNLNILAHVNSHLNADFDLHNWRHKAIYNPIAHQVEMYLESTRFQMVSIQEIHREFTFEKGERILTEISRKFDPRELAWWFESQGYRCLRQWTDSDELFGLLLLEV